jgi:hypothetical protein
MKEFEEASSPLRLRRYDSIKSMPKFDEDDLSNKSRSVDNINDLSPLRKLNQN